MIVYNLFILIDQTGDMYGAKRLFDVFESYESAKRTGDQSGYAHFSIERSNDGTGQDTVVFIC